MNDENKVMSTKGLYSATMKLAFINDGLSYVRFGGKDPEICYPGGGHGYGILEIAKHVWETAGSPKEIDAFFRAHQDEPEPEIEVSSFTGRVAVIVAEAANVYDVATRKGQLYATDPETGSDKLVGFFVPADVMNSMGKAIADWRHES
jgi:hypothetical protein